MSVLGSVGDYPCGDPLCTVTIPGDQAPGQYPGTNQPPFYPGFDLPDEPGSPGTPPPIPAHAPSFPTPHFQRPLPPVAAPAPPPAPPKPPPPSTPVGEPPPDEPAYSEYNPQVFEEIAAEAEAAGKAAAWAELAGKLFTFVGRYGGLIYAAGSDVINLLTYSADLGPAAATEAALVEANLARFPPGRLPYADPISYAVTVPPGDFPIPNAPGLPNTVVAPTDIPTVVVTAPRTQPSLAPLPLVAPVLVPGALDFGRLPGVQPSARPGLRPAYGFAPEVGRLTAVAPQTPTRLRPRVGLPHVGLLPGDYLHPSMPPVPQTQPQPQPTKPTQDDCVSQLPPKKKKQQKKHPRSVCWRGTYEERANGLLKYRKEQIPCR